MLPLGATLMPACMRAFTRPISLWKVASEALGPLVHMHRRARRSDRRYRDSQTGPAIVPQAKKAETATPARPEARSAASSFTGTTMDDPCAISESVLTLEKRTYWTTARCNIALSNREKNQG